MDELRYYIHQVWDWARVQNRAPWANAFFRMGATVTESSTWPWDAELGATYSHGHVEDSVTEAHNVVTIFCTKKLQ